MKAILALVVLLALASSVFARDCTKVSNATSCASNGFTTDPYGLTPIAGPEKELQGCIKVLLNNLCLDIDIEPWSDFFDNITISITVDRITVYQFNTTLPNLMVPGGVCLDDNTVLEILLLIPSLRNDTEAILKILEATGCTPRGLFSLCVYFDPCSSTVAASTQPKPHTGVVHKPKPNAEPICGCFSFNLQLLYFYKWCVLSETAGLGCVGQSALAAGHANIRE